MCSINTFQSPGFAVLIDRRNETWQEAQSVFEKIVTIFPAKIKEVFLVYQYTSGKFLCNIFYHKQTIFRGAHVGSWSFC